MLLLCLFALAGPMVFAGCETPTEPTVLEQTTTVDVVDDMGRTVSIEQGSKGAFLIGSFADLFADAGGEEQIAAAAHDAFTRFDLNLENAADLGDVKNISVETLLESGAQFVVASAKNESQKKLQSSLEAAGLPVVYFDVDSFDDYARMMNEMVKITGDTSALDVLEAQKSEIDAMTHVTRDDAPTILVLRATGKGVKALQEEDGVLAEMAADLHAVNIATPSMLSDLSMEAVIDANPDMIFYVLQGDESQAQASLDTLMKDPAWSSLDAVKNGKVYSMDPTLYNLKPNARWAQAYAGLEALLYPDS